MSGNVSGNRPGETADAAAVEALATAIGRLADRLRSLGAPRLGRPPTSPGDRAVALDRSVADQAHDLATSLAGLASGTAGRADVEPPLLPVVPRLLDFAVGDQVAVCGRECVEQLVGVPEQALVWWRGEQVPAGPLVSDLTARLRALRLAI